MIDKKQKVICIIATVIMIASCWFITPSKTAYAATSGDFEYTVSDGKATITGYIGEDADIIIPNELNGYDVTNININAFRYNTTLENVTLSNNTTYIGPQAFERCTNLNNVVLSNNLLGIDMGAFSGCSKLTSISLPDSLETIGNSAFAYSGLHNITVPANVTLIETYAFANCDSLTGITVSKSNPNYRSVEGILLNKNGTELLQYPNGKTGTSYSVPEGVTIIGGGAFTGSPLLEEVILPDSLTMILDNAFFGCRELKNINIPSLVTNIGNRAFWCTSLTSLTLPDSVISIGDGCFQDCNYLNNITLSNNLTRIGEGAFAQNGAIHSITIPASVEEIGARAFSSCFYLNELLVEEGNQYYKSIDGALLNYSGTNLIQYFNNPDRSSYEMPEGVTTISDGAFSHCVFLHSITISNTVRTIVNGAFERCNVETINIPASVTSMADSTFEHCTELQEISVNTNNPNFSSVGGVLFNKTGTRLLQYPSGIKKICYTVPSGVTSIVSSAFQFNNLETITMPASLSNIEGYALNDCDLLKEIIVDESNLHYSSNGGVLFDKTGTILHQYPRGKENPNYIVPSGVTEIGYHSFYETSNLENVYIPVSVNIINGSAFSDFFYSYLGTIYGESGSYAESYANSKGIHFIAGKFVLVTGVELDKKKLILRRGENAQLITSVYPDNAAVKEIIWNSSDNSVAFVSNGVVAAENEGTAIITATTKDGGFTDTCTVSVVQPVTGISLNKTRADLILGETITLNETVYPVGASNKKVKWSSSNTSVATVADGVVTAQGTGTAIITALTEDGGYSDTCTVTVSKHTVRYQTHVQDIGWQGWKSNGEVAGTSGQSLRLEGMYIDIEGADNAIEYRTHVQDIGWQGWVRDGEMTGTSGRALRLEAIEIRLTGYMAANYDIYYRVHAQNIGWMDWAKNGQSAGTAGLSYRLEAIQIQLVPKSGAVPGSTAVPFRDANGPVPTNPNPIGPEPTKPTSDVPVKYQTHVQDIGWQGWKKSGEVAGTSGQSLRLEGMYIDVEGADNAIEYRTHVQDIGWQDWVNEGEMTGTSGRSLRLEAIEIRLKGDVAANYDIYYRVHAQNIGWMDWAKNGQSAGTAGLSYRLEAIQIVIVEKGGAAPGSTARPFVSA